jgi:hypothetical protein
MFLLFVVFFQSLQIYINFSALRVNGHLNIMSYTSADLLERLLVEILAGNKMFAGFLKDSNVIL